jgi:hypothetical protein
MALCGPSAGRNKAGLFRAITAGMKRSLVLLALLFAVVSCRTARPADEVPIAPLTATTPEAARTQLAERATSLRGVRALMRVRATSGERTQSFRAQLQVEGSARMLLTAYTPLGTAAFTLFADGDRVVFVDHINRTAWRGTTAELAQSVGFFDPATPPAIWAQLVLGFPVRGQAEVTAAGAASIRNGAIAFTFDPPLFPPQHVVVSRAGSTMEIAMLEIGQSGMRLEAPEVPRDYRCCVAPQV